MFSPVFNMAQNILKTIKYKQENKKHAWNIGSAVGIMVPFHQCYFLAAWVHQTNAINAYLEIPRLYFFVFGWFELKKRIC